MIATEAGLTWRRVTIADGARGAHLIEYRCVEHPRLRRLVQRPNASEPYVETFHVDGLAQYYRSEGAALEAALMNPEPPCC